MMDDPELDTRLRSTAPQVAGPVSLADHRQRIMADLRARRRRVGQLWTGAAVATVALLGAGSVAVAGNGMETPWGWTADNVYSIPGPDGKTCFAGVQVRADGVAEDAEVMQVAREIVASIDLDTLDTSGREKELAAEIGKPFDDGAPGTVYYTPEEMKQAAVHEAVAEILFAELDEQGYAKRDRGAPVSLFAQSMGCN
jgi:hypothetical protein